MGISFFFTGAIKMQGREKKNVKISQVSSGYSKSKPWKISVLLICFLDCVTGNEGVKKHLSKHSLIRPHVHCHVIAQVTAL